MRVRAAFQWTSTHSQPMQRLCMYQTNIADALFIHWRYVTFISPSWALFLWSAYTCLFIWPLFTSLSQIQQTRNSSCHRCCCLGLPSWFVRCCNMIRYMCPSEVKWKVWIGLKLNTHTQYDLWALEFDFPVVSTPMSEQLHTAATAAVAAFATTATPSLHWTEAPQLCLLTLNRSINRLDGIKAFFLLLTQITSCPHPHQVIRVFDFTCWHPWFPILQTGYTFANV